MAHIDLETKILNKNDEGAAANRVLLDEKGVYMVNVLASPGSGKTSTIVATINALRDKYNIAVVEGDIASDVDSQTIKALGIPAVQINTAGACHLESDMLRRALDVLDLDDIDLIFIENVGNLVCPADFYLGENIKMMILSVPEGDDKPLKYPGMFQVADAIILNKTDVMPAFTFDKTLLSSASTPARRALPSPRSRATASTSGPPGSPPKSKMCKRVRPFYTFEHELRFFVLCRDRFRSAFRFALRINRQDTDFELLRFYHPCSCSEYLLETTIQKETQR